MGVVTHKGCSDGAKILYAYSVSQIATFDKVIQKLKKVAWFWYALLLIPPKANFFDSQKSQTRLEC